MGRLAAILVLLILPALAQAGAWPREQGTFFFSSSYTVKDDLDALATGVFDPMGYSAVYLEYGARPNLTFGLDVGYGDALDHSVIVFARTPVLRRSETHRFALHFGAGTEQTATGSDRLIQLGAAWGKGIQTPFGGGWMAADGSVTHRLAAADTRAKLDLTLGVKPADGLMLIVQAQSGRSVAGDGYLRLAPSLVRQFGPGRHIELGAEIGVAGDDRIGLKIGTWLEF